jgi:hypothetical protein
MMLIISPALKQLQIIWQKYGAAKKPLPSAPAPARHDLRIAMSKLPINHTTNNRLVWRDWQEEREIGLYNRQ